MSVTRSFTETISPVEIDELNGPVGSGKTLAEGRTLLSICLKYFRIDMTYQIQYTRVCSRDLARDNLRIWWSKTLANHY